MNIILITIGDTLMRLIAFYVLWTAVFFRLREEETKNNNFKNLSIVSGAIIGTIFLMVVDCKKKEEKIVSPFSSSSSEKKIVYY